MKKKYLRICISVFAAIIITAGIFNYINRRNIIKDEENIVMEVVRQNIDFFNKKNIFDYLNTLDVQEIESTKAALKTSFERYNFYITLRNMYIEEMDEVEALVITEQLFMDKDVQNSENLNKVKIFLRKSEGNWKIYKTEAYR